MTSTPHPRPIRRGGPLAPARPDAVLQRRGVERIEALLDAADALLAEEGYEAATLKAIGERAGIATASVYHYFLDRGQVETKLLERHIPAIEDAVWQAVGDGASLHTIRDVVDAVVDPMVEYFRNNPGCVELWFAGRSVGKVAAVRHFDTATAGVLLDLATQRGLLRRDTPLMVMQLAFEVGNRLFDVAFREPHRSGDDVVIEESRRLLALYLSSYATTPATSTDTNGDKHDDGEH